MNAMLDARMVAARIHGPRDFAHGAVCGADRITFSSQGSWMNTGMFLSGYVVATALWGVDP
jgi:hypothetical protein